MDTVAGGAGDDTINATGVNASTGAAETSVNSGDSVNGGAGNDTLNITATATNNTSLTGLKVAAVETVNITGSNFLSAAPVAASAAVAAAQTAKNASAAALVTAQANAVSASNQVDAATALSSALTNAEGAEAAAKFAATATSASMAAATAAMSYVAANPTVTTYPTTASLVPTTFTSADFTAARLLATTTKHGAPLVAPTDNTAIGSRATALKTQFDALNIAFAASVNALDHVEAEQAAAATAVNTAATLGTGETAGAALARVIAMSTQTTAVDYNSTGYSLAQLNAAALAALKDYQGLSIASETLVTARAGVLKTFADAVVAVSGNYSAAELNAAAAAAQVSPTGVTLITPIDDSTAVDARAAARIGTGSETAATKTAADAALALAVTADTLAASALASAQAVAAGAGSTAVSAAQFDGSTAVWLKGDTSNKTDVTDVAATQTIGFDAVTGMSNSVSYGATVAAGTIASNAAAGTLTVTGAKLASLAISGTGSTGLTLVDGSTTDTIKSLSVSTSGATVVDVAGATALTTVTSTGAGGLSLNGAGTKLATVTTGEGADSIRITTATLKDDATTAAVETVTAAVSTGNGNDSVRVEVTGAGLATVSSGEGNDSVYMKAVTTGVTTVDAGAGNDTVYLGAITFAANAGLTIAGGEGNDTLVMPGAAALTATDYLQINSAVSGFEGVTFTTQAGDSAATPATAVDVSKYAIGTVSTYTFTAGAANSVSKVGADQKLVLAKVAAVTESATAPIALASAASAATGLTAVAAGYTLGTNDSSTLTTVYGSNTLDVSTSGSATIGLVLKGAGAKVAVSATGGSSTAGLSSAVTLLALSKNDVQTLDVTLNSARGTGTNAANEYTATFNAGTVLNSGTATSPSYTYGEHLEGLTSVKVGGSGVFTITAGEVDKAVAKLTSIDVSGMTAFADQDALGAQTSTYLNKSTTTISLNNNVAETLLLGGAKDAVTTASKVGSIDTITGFQLTASATDSLAIDTARSDTLAVGATTFLKFVPTATTFVGALTQAGASTVGNNLVFAFGGDTYVYVDAGTAAGLDDGDTVVKLTGTLNLDLLIQAGVLV